MEITQQEALDCFASDDLIGIGMEADAVRRVLHPENVVTYAATREIALDQRQDDLLAAIEDRVRAGDTTVCLRFSRVSDLARAEDALTAIRQRFPGLHINALHTRQLLVLAEESRLTVRELLTRLRTAGLGAISGWDLVAAPVVPARIDRAPVPLREWLEVHRLAHRAGIASTAGLIFGLGESNEDRVRALFALRTLQAETSGFTAFTLIAPAPSADLETPTAVEYLRTLAIARIVLDNIPSIESSCVAHGLKVVQMALRFGANDAGSLAPHEADPKPAFSEQDLRRVIRDAGFTPVERDPLYRALYLNN